MHPIRCIPLLALFIFLPLWAQTNEELFRTYQFSFKPPGSRANGMGGAFIGAADDATASYANPAGLAYLTDSAVSMEWTHSERDLVTVERSAFFETNYSVPSLQIDAVNFYSLNFNWRQWFFGIFRYRFLDAEQGRNVLSRSIIDGLSYREKRDVQLRLHGETQGFGIAHRFGSWKFGISINSLDLAGETSYLRTSIVGDFSPRFIYYSSEIHDSDRGWGYHLGLHREFGRKLSLGFVWRENPVLHLSEQLEERIDNYSISDQVDVPFAIPHVLGTGFQYRFRDDLRLLGDWQRIYYSGIINRGFVVVEASTTAPEVKENYKIEDIDELHLGFEWLIPTHNSVWALRCGAYRDPQHSVQYLGEDLAVKERFEASGLEGESRFTFGLGWSFKNYWELDAAANFWDGGKEIRISSIWRMK